MTDQTETAAEVSRAQSEDKGTFVFGGRKRKEGEAFAKIERAVVFANLPAESQAFLIRYGIRQYLSDGAASAKDNASFESGIDGRIENLANADFSRNAGEGPAPTNDPEKLADTLARQELNVALKNATGVTKEQRAATLVAYRAANAVRLVAEATRQIEARKAAAIGIDLAAFGITLPTA